MDEELARRVRAALADADPVREVKMFGGVAFMLHGNMVAAASHRGLLVRVGEQGVTDALARGAQPMLMNGRQMKGFVLIATPDARAVKSWLRVALEFVQTLPAKKAARKRKAKRQSS
jgi:TfoX/Sxy family transcriptional regulator of competence genes